MELTKVEGIKAFVPLKDPFVISSCSITQEENYFIKLTSSSGLVGWGQGTPWKPATGDSFIEVCSEIGSLQWHRLNFDNTPESNYDTFTSDVSCRSLRCAIDLAVHDLFCKGLSRPVYDIYAGRHRSICSSMTVSIYEDNEETKRQVKKLLLKYPGLEVLKIKLKGTGDLHRCRAVKAGVEGQQLAFILDANEGFSDPISGAEEINQIVSELNNVLFIEEPSRKGDVEALVYFKQHIKGSKVIADESSCTLEDVKKLISFNAVNGTNIKLQKCGGITPARRIAKICQESQLSLILGCMVEFPLAISAALQVAMIHPEIEYTDLDGDQYVPKISQLIPFFKGHRNISPSAGLGYNPEDDLIGQAVQDGTLVWDNFFVWEK